MQNFPETPETVAWAKARTRNRIELAAAIAAGLGVTVMFVIFCKILTQ